MNHFALFKNSSSANITDCQNEVVTNGVAKTKTKKKQRLNCPHDEYNYSLLDGEHEKIHQRSSHLRVGSGYFNFLWQMCEYSHTARSFTNRKNSLMEVIATQTENVILSRQHN